MSLPFYPENKLWESVLQQDTEVSFFVSRVFTRLLVRANKI